MIENDKFDKVVGKSRIKKYLEKQNRWIQATGNRQGKQVHDKNYISAEWCLKERQLPEMQERI